MAIRIDNNDSMESDILQKFVREIDIINSQIERDAWHYSLCYNASVSQTSVSPEERKSRIDLHHDETKESFQLFGMFYCKNHGNKERMENVLKFMRKSQDLIGKNNSEFHHFLKRWRDMNEIMKKTSSSVENLENCFARRNSKIECIKTGCLYLFITCNSITSLDSLWQEYIRGELLPDIQNQIADVKIGITIAEKSYTSYRNYLCKLFIFLPLRIFVIYLLSVVII